MVTFQNKTLLRKQCEMYESQRNVAVAVKNGNNNSNGKQEVTSFVLLQ